MKQIFTLSPLHFVFQAKLIGVYIVNEIFCGGAKYVATGRNLPTERKDFVGKDGGLYNDFANLALYDGARLFACLLMVLAAGGLKVDEDLRGDLVFFILSVMLTITSWLLAPFIYNPYQFVRKHFAEDLIKWKQFFFEHGGRYWTKWYEESQLRPGSGLRASPVDVLIWALFIGSWYTVLNQKMHLLSIIFVEKSRVFFTMAFLLLPPIFSSLTTCFVVTAVIRLRDLTWTLTPAWAALIVVAFDLLEGLSFLWSLLRINWWKSFVLGFVLKYALLSLALTCVEYMFRFKGQGPTGVCGSIVKESFRLWLYAHRIARDIAVSLLVLILLSPLVLLGMLQSTMCLTCSVHNLLIYRDPTTIESSGRVPLRPAQATSSFQQQRVALLQTEQDVRVATPVVAVAATTVQPMRAHDEGTQAVYQELSQAQGKAVDEAAEAARRKWAESAAASVGLGLD